jgi:hypothetical protein
VYVVAAAEIVGIDCGSTSWWPGLILENFWSSLSASPPVATIVP